MIHQLSKTILVFLILSLFSYLSIAQQVTTLAGGTFGFADGTGAAARFMYPKGVAVDKDGNVYVADSYNARIRKITPAGVVTTFAGSGNSAFADGIGTAASFKLPTGLAFDASGNLFVADCYNHKIRKITKDGVVTTFAGSDDPLGGFADGPAASAQFSEPSSLAFDSYGNLLVSDYWNNRIRKITPDGIVSTVAGTGAIGYLDGPGAIAQFNRPAGISCDASNNLYITDALNNKIRKITPDGVVSTIAGSTKGFADGFGAAVKFATPATLACDNLGNIYVADNQNNRIRKIDALGEVTTYAGSDDLQQSSDGYGTAADFYNPTGICFDPHGYLYIGDENNNAIRRITVATASIPLSSQTITFGALTDKYTEDVAFTLTATASSGLAVTYTSSDLSVATVSGNTVTIVGSGSTTITASQVGNSVYNAATDVSQTLTVHKKSQTITFTALQPKVTGDAAFTLTATASSGLAVTYTSSDLSVATVSGNVITIVGSGSTTITASQLGNDVFEPASDISQKLTVSTSTAIFDKSASTTSSVYPNPARDYIIVTTPDVQNGEKAKILILNVVGIVVMENQFEMVSGGLTINTNDLAPGSYILTLETKNNFEFRQIIIQ